MKEKRLKEISFPVKWMRLRMVILLSCLGLLHTGEESYQFIFCISLKTFAYEI
jgi:hypothetical protein